MFYPPKYRGKTKHREITSKYIDMITIKLVYDRKKKATKTEPGTIEVRVTIDRKMYYYSTGVRVLPQEWRNSLVINRPDSMELNERLRIILRRVQAFLNNCMDNCAIFDSKALRNEIWPVIAQQNASTDMLDWLTREKDLLNLAAGTMKHYDTLITRLGEYGKLSSWRDLTVENIYAFDTWLHQLKAQDGSGPISDAAVYNYHKSLKALLNRALNVGKLQNNPYDMLKGRFKRGDKESVEYLTEEEMERFMALVVPEHTAMGLAKDLFIFQMYTGMAYSDVMAFDISRYHKEGRKWVANGERIKTGTPFVSQLLPPAIEILKKYDYKLPYLDNADYNHSLKLLGQIASISTKLHSHLARHTFATYMLRNGAKIENVSRMLGHTNITQTQRYAKVLAQSVHEDFDMITKKMKKKKKS